jgi:hypothetical protein
MDYADILMHAEAGNKVVAPFVNFKGKRANDQFFFGSHLTNKYMGWAGKLRRNIGSKTSEEKKGHWAWFFQSYLLLAWTSWQHNSMSRWIHQAPSLFR